MSTFFNQIKQGTVQITPEEVLKKKLKTGLQLIVKLGMDPTAPDLHLGHVVVLKKLRQFQDQGHKAVLVIGDFTALIGDPTGRSKTRKPLTADQIQKNQETYIAQACRILDLSTLSIVYNSNWLGSLRSIDFIELCAKTTLARIIERDDFQKRFQERYPIGLHELLYPLMQGYDSVALGADVELGGTDQTFNLMMGRFLQESYDKIGQVVVTVPLLKGLDGTLKMSKSLNNAIVIDQPADNAFGQLMSISDDLMWEYAALLLDYQEKQIEDYQLKIKNGSLHPFDFKKDIAEAIVAKWWSPDAAVDARKNFVNVFQKHIHDSIVSIKLSFAYDSSVWIVDLVKELSSVVLSSSDVRRLIESGAISLDGVKITNFKEKIVVKRSMVVKIGKYFICRIS